MKSVIQIVRLSNGHEYYLPTDEEVRSFKDIAEVVVQETMTKAEYDRQFGPPIAISKGLDDAITDELKNGPKSIMGREG